MKVLLRVSLTLLVLAGASAGAVLWLDRLPDDRAAEAAWVGTAGAATSEVLARGAMLARAGNCMACHTTRGGEPYAGGRAIATPFGTVYTSNLTPDEATGLGRWSAADFWVAMHHGRSRDGKRLVPAFPYTDFTRLTRADSDALYTWLRTVPAVQQERRAHELHGLYGHTLALAAWRVLFFKPAAWADDPAQSAQWNRGAYLVNAVAHCGACHGSRNRWGAPAGEPWGGGLLPSGHWYAPSLDRTDEAGVRDWPLHEIVALLRDGVTSRGRVSGPMAEVVLHGTQHLPEPELRAMAVFLKSLPESAGPSRAGIERRAGAVSPDATRTSAGEKLYADHCAQCHGTQGEGGITAAGETVIPALAGNRLVTLDPPVNVVRAVALGGFAPATAGHPRPFGMPPFAHALSDEDLARVLTYLRSAWGHQATPISAFDVARGRGAGDD